MKHLRTLRILTLALGPALLASCGNGNVAPYPTEAVPQPVEFTGEGCVEGDFDPYLGVLHAHTSYSDGEQTPADAFAYGRDEGDLDILLITDHLEQIYLPFPVDEKWNRCHEQADAAYDPGRFLADCGFEYGSGFSFPPLLSSGHNNVFFSGGTLFPIVQLDFHDFYQSLEDCPSCIGQFNHPGSNPGEHWNHFEYFPAVDEKMNLFEFNSDPAWEMFFEALDAGWHVSPMNNQDNHGPNWGTRNEDRSGFFLSTLTREGLYEAMQARRSFMGYDSNASIRLTAFGKCWMGSILSGEMPPSISLEVEALDPDAGDGWTEIEIYGPGRELLGSFDCGGRETCRAAFTFGTETRGYFVARANQADGGWLVSAPVWIDPE